MRKGVVRCDNTARAPGTSARQSVCATIFGSDSRDGTSTFTRRLRPLDRKALSTKSFASLFWVAITWGVAANRASDRLVRTPG